MKSYHTVFFKVDKLLMKRISFFLSYKMWQVTVRTIDRMISVVLVVKAP